MGACAPGPSCEAPPVQTVRSVPMPPLPPLPMQPGLLPQAAALGPLPDSFPARGMPARRHMGRSQSAVDLHLLGSSHRRGSPPDLRHLEQVGRINPKP